MKTSLFPCVLAVALACTESRPPSPERARSGPDAVATAAVATRLTDIYPSVPSAAGSNPTALASIGPRTFLAATDAKHGEELWVTDGTPAGTRLLMDLYPGPSSSSPRAVGVVNGVLLFTAAHGASASYSRRYLWRTDGTTAGTQLIDAPPPDDLGAGVANGQLFFLASSRGELWKSDGTAAGTVMVKDIDQGSFGSEPAGLHGGRRYPLLRLTAIPFRQCLATVQRKLEVAAKEEAEQCREPGALERLASVPLTTPGSPERLVSLS